MNLRDLAITISQKIKSAPGEYMAYEDYYNVCREIMKENLEMGVAGLRWFPKVLKKFPCASP